MQSGVYAIIHLPTKRKYIGSSKNVNKRFYYHRWDLNNQKHANPKLQNSWNFHGKDEFAFVNFVPCEESERLKIEQKLLDSLKPYYNSSHCATGGFGRKHTESSKAKMRVSQKIAAKKRGSWNKGKTGIYSQETIEKIRAAAKAQPRRYGFKLSEEHKAKLSAAHKGKPSWNKGKKLSEEHIKKLSQAKLGKKLPPRNKEWCERLSKARKAAWEKQKNNKNGK
jgi:hypothetical protein